MEKEKKVKKNSDGNQGKTRGKTRWTGSQLNKKHSHVVSKPVPLSICVSPYHQDLTVFKHLDYYISK